VQDTIETLSVQMPSFQAIDDLASIAPGWRLVACTVALL
jgi:hypothetical protein